MVYMIKVAGEIKHYLRDRSQTIRQPAWLQELRHKVNRATNEMQGELGRAPTDRAARGSWARSRPRRDV